MKSRNKNRLATLLLVVSLTAPVYAAEIRGQVRLQGPAAGYDPALAVLVLPHHGQAHAKRMRIVRIEMRNGRLSRRLVVLSPGDRLKIVNHDPVTHPLVLFNARRQKAFVLARAGKGQPRHQEWRFPRRGEWHLLGRLDSRLYARIVVAEARQIRYARIGRRFELRGLQPGAWKLRILSLTGRDLEVTAEAYTAPATRQWVLVPGRKAVPERRVVIEAAVTGLYRGSMTTR